MKVTVIGAGSWGTAIANSLAGNGHDVYVWSYTKEEADELNTYRENIRFLKGHKLRDNITITTDMDLACKDSRLIACTVPSFATRQTARSLAKCLTGDQIVVNLSKGLEDGSCKRLSEVYQEELPDNKIAVLSGPTHAEEIIVDLPSTLVVATADSSVALFVQDVFMNKNLRVYTSEDVIGVELGGALKNIIALCAGISDGLGYKDNTKAALMTRGLMEITRMGVKLGANFNTFLGLSGVGDLIVTCTSMNSRNRRAGILIGQGKSLKQAQDEIKMVIEGANTVKAARKLAVENEISMPIVEEAYQILVNGKDPREAVMDLMTRDKTKELNV